MSGFLFSRCVCLYAFDTKLKIYGTSANNCGFNHFGRKITKWIQNIFEKEFMETLFQFICLWVCMICMCLCVVLCVVNDFPYKWKRKKRKKGSASRSSSSSSSDGTSKTTNKSEILALIGVWFEINFDGDERWYRRRSIQSAIDCQTIALVAALQYHISSNQQHFSTNRWSLSRGEYHLL